MIGIRRWCGRLRELVAVLFGQQLSHHREQLLARSVDLHAAVVLAVETDAPQQAASRIVAERLIVDRVSREFSEQLRIDDFLKRLRKSPMQPLESPNRERGHSRLDSGSSPYDGAGQGIGSG